MKNANNGICLIRLKMDYLKHGELLIRCHPHSQNCSGFRAVRGCRLQNMAKETEFIVIAMMKNVVENGLKFCISMVAFGADRQARHLIIKF